MILGVRMIKFICLIVLTAITWPIIFILGASFYFFIAFINLGNIPDNLFPFISPNALYFWYKEMFLSVYDSITDFIDKELK